MDISSSKTYPAGTLSNFSPHPFVIDGVECSSMEGFLQSLKFKNPEMQKEICKLTGIAAKRAGKKKNWRQRQVLFWKGEEIERESSEYQCLLNRAYNALFRNTTFKKALLSTRNAVLTHSIGKTNPKDTVLTRAEFCSRLTHLRDVGLLDEGKPKGSLFETS